MVQLQELEGVLPGAYVEDPLMGAPICWEVPQFLLHWKDG